MVTRTRLTVSGKALSNINVFLSASVAVVVYKVLILHYSLSQNIGIIPYDVIFLSGGVYELRHFFGFGYRVYFAEDGVAIVILLCGGDKDSQSRDIQQAQTYWQEYQTRD